MGRLRRPTDSGFIFGTLLNRRSLTAEEILKLNLKAELVVLSACNTAKGKITGDGVIG